MTADAGARAAGLLVSRAWDSHAAGRYTEALSAAGRAVEAATRMDDPVLLVRALEVEGAALSMRGDKVGALAKYTRILGLADDPATARRLDRPSAVRVIASAHWSWVECARFITSIGVRDLFGALDAADRWLAATGHRDWRAAVLLQRAHIHHALGEYDDAVTCAREALAVKVRHPGTPGYSLSNHRSTLGDRLRNAGRAAEAAPHYQAVLDDPASSPWVRRAAHRGLAECALAAGDPATARREAERSVQLAEPLGDESLCTSLDTLVRICRADGDLDAAWHAADRWLEAATRIGGHLRLYYAAEAASDIALDRGDLGTARRLLDDLDTHARAMDTATGTTVYTAAAARRRRRLA